MWVDDDCGGADGFYDNERPVTWNRSDWYPRVDPYADSDGDGMDDRWETRYGLDPTDPTDASADLDGDTLDNREEFEAGTDPTDADTNGNGLTDAEDPDPWYVESTFNQEMFVWMVAFMISSMGLCLGAVAFQQRLRRMRDW
jgi:hypothetical protein